MITPPQRIAVFCLDCGSEVSILTRDMGQVITCHECGSRFRARPKPTNYYAVVGTILLVLFALAVVAFLAVVSRL